jgi:hypothetical protein
LGELQHPLSHNLILLYAKKRDDERIWLEMMNKSIYGWYVSEAAGENK